MFVKSWVYQTQKETNEGKSAAGFCYMVAALVPDMFCHFKLVKNHKIANNSTTDEAGEKNKHIFGILRNLEIVWCTFNWIWKLANFT
jgi:hypothetical protein